MSASKFIWTSKALSEVSSFEGYSDSLIFSGAGWLATHDIKFYLPLVNKAAETSAMQSTTAVFAKDGKYYTLPANAFKDTTYTATTDTASDSAVVTSFGLDGTAFTATTTNVSQIKLAGYSTVSTASEIATTDTLGTALAKLQKQIDDARGIANAGMSFKGVTSSSTEFGTTTGDTYVIGADGTTPSGVTAAVGDTIIRSGSSWVVVPSGNDARFSTIKAGSTNVTATTSGSTLEFAAGAKTVVALSGSSDATVTYSHAIAAALTSTAGTQTTLKHDGKNPVNVITAITTDGYGHLTGYTLTPMVLGAITASGAGTAATWGGTQTVGSVTIDGGTPTVFLVKLPNNPNSVTSLGVESITGGVQIKTTEDNGVNASNAVVKIKGDNSVTVEYDTVDKQIKISAVDNSRVNALGVAASTTGNDATFTITNSDASTVAGTMLLDDSFTYTSTGLDIVWGTI